MQLICIGYYDKFSRLFIGIEKALKKDGLETSILIVSIYLSGFLFGWLRFKKSLIAPFAAWRLAKKQKQKYFKIIEEGDYYRSINFKELIKYHLKINNLDFQESLQIQALSYIDLYFDLFIKNKPNAILVIGDSRLAIESAIAVAKKLNIKILYLEKGPFNTTIIDKQGVNANASIKNYLKTNSLTNQLNRNIDWIHQKSKDYLRSPLYRLIDMIFDVLFKNSSFYPPDLANTDVNRLKIRHKDLNNGRLNIQNNKLKYLLIFQIPNDVNFILHSPYFENHFELLKSVYINLPDNAELIVREHPLYKGLYGDDLYSYLNEQGILLESNNNLNDAFRNADVIIVNNSTSGLEAIANFKTLVVLGDAYYAHPDVCLVYNGKNLKQLFEKSINFRVNHQYCKSLLNLIKEQLLVDGSITDKELKCADSIAKMLKEEIT